MTAAIETRGLTKRYGRSRGIIDVDLVVETGQIFGFLGPNGAGKSTTIRLLFDLIRPSAGEARVLGLDVHRDRLAIDRRTSYVPGELSLYSELTGRQLLTYLGNLQGHVDEAYRESLIQRLELDPTKRIKSLSRGNKQKVGLVAAFMIRPELMIFDEPTAGLDPFVQLEFEHLCEEVRDEGNTVFISSHQLPEVEHLCDRVGIIREGRLLAVELITDLKDRAIRRLEIDFGGPVQAESFANLPGVQDLVVDDGVLRCTIMGSVDALIKKAAGFEVRSIRSIDTSLEEIFMAYYGSGEAADESAAGEASHAAA
jgi:ABC-2 type transport system ATP-binding protein